MSIDLPESQPQNQPSRSASSARPSLGILFKNTDDFSRPQLAVFVVVFALVSYVLSKGFAAAPLVTAVEMEQMRLPPASAITLDPTASKSKAVVLTPKTILSSRINLPSEVTSLTLNAKTNACQGSPVMEVIIDGARLISNTSVTPTAWASYSAKKNLTRGQHSLSIAYIDNTVPKTTASKPCDTNLYIDVISFYGPNQKPVR